jgi:hypothetical protein
MPMPRGGPPMPLPMPIPGGRAKPEGGPIMGPPRGGYMPCIHKSRVRGGCTGVSHRVESSKEVKGAYPGSGRGEGCERVVHGGRLHGHGRTGRGRHGH